MTTTINDISDLARILEEHPEWVDTLRSMLLTKEILDLPAALERLTQLVNDFVQEQRETNQRTDRLLTSLEGRVTHLEEIGVSTDRRLTSLETITRRMQGQIGLLRGEAAERHLQGHLDVVLSQRLNLRRVVTLKSINRGIDRSLAEQLEEAQDNQIITPGQHLQVRLVDVILSATDRETAAPVYIAAEVSLTLNRNDIDRAAERAAILERATGVATKAAVIGGRIPPLQETQAATAGVHIVLMEDLDLDSEVAGD